MDGRILRRSRGTPRRPRPLEPPPARRTSPDLPVLKALNPPDISAARMKFRRVNVAVIPPNCLVVERHNASFLSHAFKTLCTGARLLDAFSP